MLEEEFSLDLDSILKEFNQGEEVQIHHGKEAEQEHNDSTVVFRPEPSASVRHPGENSGNIQAGKRNSGELPKGRTEKALADRAEQSRKLPPERSRTEKKPASVKTVGKFPGKTVEKNGPGRGGRALYKTVGILLTAVCIFFGAVNIHPATGSYASLKGTELSVNIAGAVDAFAAEAAETKRASMTAAEAQTAVQDLPQAEPEVPQKSAFSIPETDLVAPVPDIACYGSVMPENAGEIMNVVRQAEESGLLAGQSVIFSPDADFRSDTAIRYYLDDSLMVICWKEIIDGNTCSLVEVKMADASQFRRKFADDAFGASNTYYATDLAKSVNSVVAMNADYYLFRDFGIVVYNRELYRFNESTYTGEYKKYNCVDTCFVTEDGELLYFKRGQVTTEEELGRYIEENNILFSIAFGPVLVENSEAVYVDWYPVGEIDKGYSRAGIGQADDLHYLYMSLNHSNEKQARWDINTFAQHFAEKGVRTAYALDGGQTSEIVFQGEPYNYIDFGAERLVSDIIYFASAIPSEEAGG